MCGLDGLRPDSRLDRTLRKLTQRYTTSRHEVSGLEDISRPGTRGEFAQLNFRRQDLATR